MTPSLNGAGLAGGDAASESIGLLEVAVAGGVEPVELAPVPDGLVPVEPAPEVDVEVPAVPLDVLEGAPTLTVWVVLVPLVVVVVVPSLVVVVVVELFVVVTGHDTDAAWMTTPGPKLQLDVLLAGDGAVGEDDEGTGGVAGVLDAADEYETTGAELTAADGLGLGAGTSVGVGAGTSVVVGAGATCAGGADTTAGVPGVPDGAACIADERLGPSVWAGDDFEGVVEPRALEAGLSATVTLAIMTTKAIRMSFCVLVRRRATTDVAGD